MINFRIIHGSDHSVKDIPEMPPSKKKVVTDTAEAPRSLIRCLGEARTRDSVFIPTELRHILKTGLWALKGIFSV